MSKTEISNDSGRETWSNKATFILSAVGAAVGLGNIWMFPYSVGQNGGGLFIILYTIFLFFAVLPLLCAEIIIGKKILLNPIQGINQIAKRLGVSQKWDYFGRIGLITSILILSFYCVVTGWSLKYLYSAAVGELVSVENYGLMFEQFTKSPFQQLLYSCLSAAMTMAVIVLGVQNGVEKLNVIFIPFLLILLFVLAVYCIVSDTFNSTKALEFLFSFSFEVNSFAEFSKIMIEALSRALFSLATGVGAMMVYGSYLKKDQNGIYKSSLLISVLQLVIGLLVGITIFSIVFSDNSLTASAGPGLMFITIPVALKNFTYSYFITLALFFTLFFAALTSAINIAEFIVSTISEIMKLSRARASLLVGCFLAALTSIEALSFNILSDIKLLKFDSIFDFTISLSTDVLLSFGGLIIAIFSGYILPRAYFFKELGVNRGYYSMVLLLIRYVSTPIMMGVFLVSLYSFFSY